VGGAVSWTDDLHEASFRGADFYVKGAEDTYGRRTVVTEYPGRDAPSTDDLGRLARRVRIDAYVIGPNYLAMGKALRDAIEESGAGELVHPFVGRLSVRVVGETRQVWTTNDGGVSQITFTCVEDGDEAIPKATAATLPAVVDAADAAVAAVSESFEESFSTTSVVEEVRTAAAARVVDATDALRLVQVRASSALSAADESSVLVDEIASTAATLVQSPAALAESLAGATRATMASASTIPAAIRDLIAGATRLPSAGGPTSYKTRGDVLLHGLTTLTTFGDDMAVVSSATPQGAGEAANQAAVVRLMRALGVTEAARAAAGLEYESSTQALSMRAALGTAISAVSEDANDVAFAALGSLRAVVSRHLTDVGARLPALTVYTPPVTAPALLLAHWLYGDITREAEIVARNNVANPCAVPGGVPLEILGDA